MRDSIELLEGVNPFEQLRKPAQRNHSLTLASASPQSLLYDSSRPTLFGDSTNQAMHKNDLLRVYSLSRLIHEELMRLDSVNLQKLTMAQRLIEHVQQINND